MRHINIIKKIVLDIYFFLNILPNKNDYFLIISLINLLSDYVNILQM